MCPCVCVKLTKRSTHGRAALTQAIGAVARTKGPLFSADARLPQTLTGGRRGDASGVTHSYVLNLLLVAELFRVATPLGGAKAS